MRIRPIAVHTVVLVLRAIEIAFRAEDLCEIELGVGLRSRIGSTTTDPCADRVEVFGLVEVSEVGVQPAEAIEQPMMDRFVTDAFGEGQTLSERGQRIVIVALAGQC